MSHVTRSATEQSSSQPATLLHSGRMYWRYFLPAWLFPFPLAFGSDLIQRLGHPQLIFFVGVDPVFFFAFGRAQLPAIRKQVPARHSMFWAELVPFMLWIVALALRILMGAAFS